MKAWLLKQLNLTGEFADHLDEVSLTFQNPRLLALGLALLLPIALFIYFRQKRNLPTVPIGLRITLSLTRILILLMLVLVLGSPFLKLDHKAENKPIVAVLFDHSQSMQLPAGPYESEGELLRIAEAAGYRASGAAADADTRRALNRMSRAKLAQAVVGGSAGPFFQKLAKNFDVQYFSFSGDLTRIGVDPAAPKLPEPPTLGGPRTQMGDAVTKVLDDAAGRHVAGIVLLGDGQNNGGRPPAEAAAAAKGMGTPIFTVPVGSSRRLQDVAIVDLFATSLVTVEDTVRVAVTIESHGFDKRPVKVQLRDGDVLLDAKDIILRDTEQQQVELSFKAKKVGAHFLTVTVPPQPEEPEHLRANNTDNVFVRVSEDKLKVLLIEGRPHWDFRFLKNALRRDNGIGGRTGKEVDIRLETEWRRLSKADQAKALPRSLDQLAEYHTVILGDVSRRMLDDDFIDLLVKAVREGGLGLVVQAGPMNMPHRFDEKLQDLLPVRLRKGVPGRYPRGVPSFRLELAPEGSIHEAMRFYDEPGRNQNAWANLPRYYWCAAAERPAPGATVLAWNPIQTDYGKLPLIAHHFAGRGRVLFVGTDETFRWRQNVGERFFYRFWGQATRFVARRDVRGGKKSWIEVRPLRAQPGENAEIELMAFGPDGVALGDPKQVVQVTGGGKMQAVELSADPLVKGRYTGRITPTSAGEYLVAYTPVGEKEPVEGRLRVTNATEELRQPNVNRDRAGDDRVRLAGTDGRIARSGEHRGQAQGRLEVHGTASRGELVGQLAHARAAYLPVYSRCGASPTDGVVMRTRCRLILGALSRWLCQLPCRSSSPSRPHPGCRAKRRTGDPTARRPRTEVQVVARVNARVDRALDYLERTQIKEGAAAGAWRADNNAVNAMAVLAFLSRGHVPGRGKYGDTVEDGVVKPGVLTLAKKFILSQALKTKGREGYLAIGGGRMYEHGMATLALVEMYGMDPDPDLEEAARKAVNLILRSQGTVGGWNYEPTASDGDLSVSVMQIVAMRAASNAEIPVPETAIKKAIAYVRGKANPTGPGFGYNGPNGGTVQTSAAGCLSMQLLGAYSDPQIDKTLNWLAASVRPTWKGSGTSYFYYFHYYAMQAFYQHGGKQWNEWHPAIREMLLENQNKDGSWDTPDGSEVSVDPTTKTYSTALATLVLNIYQHFLPAYQR